MELTKNLISLHGVMHNLQRQTGEFVNIKYRGGNEEKIHMIVEEFRKFFTSKGFMSGSDEDTKTELTGILFFLFINTEFKHSSLIDTNEWTHLQTIIPQLSKCVLVNVILKVKLASCFIDIFKKLPLEVIKEVIDETLPCIERSSPDEQLNNSSVILKGVIEKLTTIDEGGEQVENLLEAVNEVLLRLRGFQFDKTGNWKPIRLQQHMGYVLLNLVDILLTYDCHNENVGKLIEKIINTCVYLVQTVSVTTYCIWAEVEIDGHNLQTTISWKTYKFIEKYEKRTYAKELIKLFGHIAKKPKTLDELIYESDTSTVIRMVDNVCSEQKEWYKALMTAQNLRTKEALECATRWSHLSDPEDVNYLMNLSLSDNNVKLKELCIKAASSQSLNDIQTIVSGGLYRNGFQYVLNDKVQQQLMIYFNKLQEGQIKEDLLLHETYLLIFQNPSVTLKYFINECLRNTFYISCLKPVFSSTKELANIKSCGVNVINNVITECKPNEQNVNCYIQLFNVLMETGFLSEASIVNNIILPRIQENVDDNLLDMKYFIHIISMLNIKNETRIKCQLLIAILLKLLGSLRSYNSLKHEVLSDVLRCFNKLKDNVNKTEGELIDDFESPFQRFYIDYILEKRGPFLSYFDVNITCDNYGEVINKLIQILPKCILDEWSIVTLELLQELSVQKTSEMLTDLLLLLCQVEDKKDNGQSSEALEALSLCLKYYGNIIKDIIRPEINKSERDHGAGIELVKNICRLLRELPTKLKQTEGLSLISLIPEAELKSLSNDKSFISLIVSINDTVICKILAQKMLDQ